jgi:myo-inositol-1(or 4)-monophosphatase
MTERQRFEQLISEVTACSEYAAKAQESIKRTYKEDGSVLTKTDTQINSRLSTRIRELFPTAGIISEEEASVPSESGASYIFCLDPIDGTDAYSQGFPSWCIAVGILDQDLRPVGGIVSAPRFGPGTDKPLLVYRLPSEGIYLQGERFNQEKSYSSSDGLIVSSKAFKHVDLSAFPGKVRSFGSTILHILSPLIFSHIQAALVPSCFIWDIAAAEGIINERGLKVTYLDGRRLDYRQITDRSPSRGYSLAATEEVYHRIRDQITVRQR